MKAKHKIGISVAVIFVALLVIGKLVNIGFRMLYKPTYDTLHTVFEDTTTYNALLIGNSKIEYGMNPLYLDSIAGLNSINFGYAASNLPTHELLLRAYLSTHKTPDFLILGIENNEFFTGEDHCNKLPLYDYLRNPLVSAYFDSLKLPYKLPKYIPFSKIVYMDDYSRFGMIHAFRGKSLFQTEDIYHYKGFYISKKGQKGLQFAPAAVKDTLRDLNEKALFHFNNIAQICKENNIILILTFPPKPHAGQHSDTSFSQKQVIEYLEQNQSRYGFYTLRNDTINSYTPNDFVDGSHLTYEGSVKYGCFVGDFLRKLKNNEL